MVVEVGAGTSVAGRLSLPLVTAEEAYGADGAVVAGADGLLAAAAQQLTPSTPILFVPDASSDLARMFRFDQQPLRRRMEAGAPYPADLGVVSGPDGEVPFVAHAVASRTGRLRPWWARRRSVTVHRDGRVEEHTATAVVIANAQHLDGRTVAPRAALMDGRADIQLLVGGPAGRAKASRLMERGLHLRHPAIHRRSVGAVGIEAAPTWRLRADGVDAGNGPWDVRIEASAYTLWV